MSASSTRRSTWCPARLPNPSNDVARRSAEVDVDPRPEGDRAAAPLHTILHDHAADRERLPGQPHGVARREAELGQKLLRDERAVLGNERMTVGLPACELDRAVERKPWRDAAQLHEPDAPGPLPALRRRHRLRLDELGPGARRARSRAPRPAGRACRPSTAGSIARPGRRPPGCAPRASSSSGRSARRCEARRWRRRRARRRRRKTGAAPTTRGSRATPSGGRTSSRDRVRDGPCAARRRGRRATR